MQKITEFKTRPTETPSEIIACVCWRNKKHRAPLNKAKIHQSLIQNSIL